MFPELPMDKLKRMNPERLAAIEFPDREDFKQGLKVALSNAIPYDVLGRHTLVIIPEDESIFKGIPYTIGRIRKTSEFSPEERGKISRKHYFPLQG